MKSPDTQAACHYILHSWVTPGKPRDTREPLYYHGWTVIPAWISKYIYYKVLDEITYPFLNFSGCAVEV